MSGRVCHLKLGRMAAPHLSRRSRHVTPFTRPQSPPPRTPQTPPPARGPLARLAAPPRRDPPAPRRRRLGQRHRPPRRGPPPPHLPRPPPHHLRRPPRLRAAGAGVGLPAAPPRRTTPPDPGPAGRHLAAGRDAPLRAGPALRALVAQQAPRLPPAAGPPGDQPRAPAPP